MNIDNSDFLCTLLTDADVLLLDFDGPVCSLFSGYPAHYVASKLRSLLLDIGHYDLPSGLKNSEDPFDIFRHAATLGGYEAQFVEAELRAYEIKAATVARPTPGTHELMTAWHALGKRTAIVSNNSTAAVLSYLQRQNATKLIAVVVGRENSDPSTLKPNKYLVRLAIEKLNAVKQRCVMVGDSTSDVEAAISTGINIVGFANKARKFDELSAAGASCVVSSMSSFVDRLTSFPR